MRSAWASLFAEPQRFCHDSVRRWLISDNREADDLIVLEAEVARHDQFSRKVGLIVLSVVRRSYYNVAVVLDDLSHVERDLVANNLLFNPLSDCFEANDLAAVIIYVGIFSERCGDRIRVEGVHGIDVLGNDARQLHWHVLSTLSMTRPDGRDALMVVGTVGGESRSL
jgi:hypothetical protein